MVLRYSCTMLRYIQRKAKKSLAGKHPIPKEFWNNGHAGSRLALSYLNCYGQAESRMPIIPKFFGPEILEFCPRSNQRKKMEFRAQLAARAQNADFSWKSDEVRARAASRSVRVLQYFVDARARRSRTRRRVGGTWCARPVASRRCARPVANFWRAAADRRCTTAGFHEAPAARRRRARDFAHGPPAVP